MQIYTGDTVSLITYNFRLGLFWPFYSKKSRACCPCVLSMELKSIPPWVAQVFPRIIHIYPLALKKVIVSTYGVITAWCGRRSACFLL